MSKLDDFRNAQLWDWQNSKSDAENEEAATHEFVHRLCKYLTPRQVDDIVTVVKTLDDKHQAANALLVMNIISEGCPCLHDQFMFYAKAMRDKELLRQELEQFAEKEGQKEDRKEIANWKAGRSMGWEK